MARDDRQDVMHFQIGEVAMSLRTPLRSLRSQYLALYEDFRVPQRARNSIRIEVRPSQRSLRHRRCYRVYVDGRLRFEPTRFKELLPYVEWAVNWELARVMPQFLQLHASSMEINGQGVILPGASGSGKSTLTTGLIADGWRYLCDEFALIHSGTLELHPFPRAICVKKPAFSVMESLGFHLQKARHYHKGTKGDVVFLNPLNLRPNGIGRTCPVRYVVFPRYAAGAEPALVPISRAEAALDMHHVCFNLFGCRTLGVEVLAKLVRGASCYRLISGEIGKTCRLLRGMVEQAAQPQALSA